MVLADAEIMQIMKSRELVKGQTPRFLAFCWLMRLVLSVNLATSPMANAVALSGPVTVLAFTDSRRYPISHYDSPEVELTIYDLAAPKLAMAELNATLQLPANPALAAALAKDYLQQHQAELAQRILPAYVGLGKAINLGISHFPALVFNGEAVIVGITDIQQGLAIYRDWLQGQASQ